MKFSCLSFKISQWMVWRKSPFSNKNRLTKQNKTEKNWKLSTIYTHNVCCFHFFFKFILFRSRNNNKSKKKQIRHLTRLTWKKIFTYLNLLLLSMLSMFLPIPKAVPKWILADKQTKKINSREREKTNKFSNESNEK